MQLYGYSPPIKPYHIHIIHYQPQPAARLRNLTQNALHCDACVEVIVMEFGIVQRLILTPRLRDNL